MRKKLTYAMIGGASGSFIGPIHRMAVQMDNLADLVAGCFSRDAEKNAATGVALEIDPARLYADGRALIEGERGKVDFLVICTPNDTHYALARYALESGMDVLCEKPLSLSVAEAAELSRVASRRRRLLAVPFTYTGYPMMKLARDLVGKGELGRIDKVVIEYVQGSFRKIDFTKPLDKRNAWKMNPKVAGPSCVVADIGVHAFTMLEYVTGLNVRSLLADLSSYAPGNRLDDDASILMRLDKGAKAALVTSKVATGEENGVRLRVYGDKASLYWNQEAPNYLTVKYPFAPDRTYKRNAPYVGGLSAGAARASRIPAGHHEGFIEAVANIYDEFCLAVRDRKTHDYPGAREGVRAMRFVDAALASHNDGNVWKRV
jgi:predicted dehydrogenase